MPRSLLFIKIIASVSQTRLPDLTCHKKCPLYSWPFNYTLLSLFIYWIALILHRAWRQSSLSGSLPFTLCLISRCPPIRLLAWDPSHGSRELLVWTASELERRMSSVSERKERMSKREGIEGLRIGAWQKRRGNSELELKQTEWKRKMGNRRKD